MRAIRASAYWRLTTTIASIHYSLPHTQLPQPAAGSASRSSQEFPSSFRFRVSRCCASSVACGR